MSNRYVYFIMIYESNDLKGDKRLAILVLFFQTIPAYQQIPESWTYPSTISETIFSVSDNSLKGFQIPW